MSKNRAIGFILGTASLCLVLDQVSKLLVLTAIEPYQSVALWQGVLQLTHTYNTGIAFSLFAEHPQLLTLATGLLLTALASFWLIKPPAARFYQLATGMIIGGALGNLVDRIRLGHVTDFIDVTIIHYPVFNMADCAIVLGVIVVMAHILQDKAQTLS